MDNKRDNQEDPSRPTLANDAMPEPAATEPSEQAVTQSSSSCNNSQGCQCGDNQDCQCRNGQGGQCRNRCDYGEKCSCGEYDPYRVGYDARVPNRIPTPISSPNLMAMTPMLNPHVSPDKQSREATQMGAVAASMAMDGSINPAMADPSRPSSSRSGHRRSNPISISSGPPNSISGAFANVSQALRSSLTASTESFQPIAANVKENIASGVAVVTSTISHVKDEAGKVTTNAKEESKEVHPEDGEKTASLVEKAVDAVSDVATDLASKASIVVQKLGQSIDPGQVTDPEGIIPIQAVVDKSDKAKVEVKAEEVEEKNDEMKQD